jgi:hypothetical protein
LIYLPDTPRNAYMNTIKIILFFMEAETHFAVADRTGEKTVINLDLATPGERSSPEKSEQQPPPPPQNGNHAPRRPRRRRRASPM